MSIHAIIPTFNPDRVTLARAIASALACHEVQRVTVVDDGSHPSVDFDPADPRVEILRRPNAGPAAARNAGLDRVESEWVLMLDDDDELIPRGVAAALALARSLQAVGAVVGRVEVCPGIPDRPRPAPPEWAGKHLPSPASAFRPITLFNASGTLIAGKAIRGGLRYDPALMIGEDRELIRRLADLGPVAVSAECVVRSGVRSGGERLTSASHLERRAADHLIIMDRWLDASSRHHFKSATRWLLNALSRTGVMPGPAHARLLAFASAQHWIGPTDRLKWGIRRVFRTGAAERNRA